jgi:transcriptional regulator with XRE-family HTH domain
MTITFKQCRAARELLLWKQTDLQKSTNLGIETISQFERGLGNQSVRTLGDIKKAFEDNGIEFINDENEEGLKIVRKVVSTQKPV